VTNEIDPLQMFFQWEMALQERGVTLEDIAQAMGYRDAFTVDWKQLEISDLPDEMQEQVSEALEDLEFSIEDLEFGLRELRQYVNDLPLIPGVYGIEDTLPGLIFLPAVDLFEADYNQFIEDYNAMVGEVEPVTSMVLFQSWVFRQLSRLYVMFWRVSELLYDKELDFENILRGRRAAHIERYDGLFTPDDDKE
jgi:hypothetical protein